MGFTFHVHHHIDPAVERKLDWIVNALRNIIQGQKTMALDFTRLQAEVAENASVIDSAVALLTQVAQDIRDAAGNAVRINELADQLDAKSNALAAAIAANTPAEPAPGASE